jgi:hypothetical protein
VVRAVAYPVITLLHVVAKRLIGTKHVGGHVWMEKSKNAVMQLWREDTCHRFDSDPSATHVRSLVVRLNHGRLHLVTRYRLQLVPLWILLLCLDSVYRLNVGRTFTKCLHAHKLQLIECAPVVSVLAFWCLPFEC